MSNQKPLTVSIEDSSPQNPKSLVVLANKYLHHVTVKNYSLSTITSQCLNLTFFIRWCYERYFTLISEITTPMLEMYVHSLYEHHNKRTGEKLTLRTVQRRISHVCFLFRWGTKNSYLLINPADSIPLPKVKRALPGNIFSQEEVDTILNLPDINTALGIRDRAIMELFYSSGIRRFELIRLTVPDLDLERGILIVKEGKGRKDRYVPVTDRACQWLKKYLHEVRSTLATPENKDTLFLTRRGKPFTQAPSVSLLIRRYINNSEIKKAGACHIFRHTMATLMLENGADIRYIQEILGHQDISSTQIYTRVSIKELKRVHFRTHPGNIPLEEETEDGK